MRISNISHNRKRLIAILAGVIVLCIPKQVVSPELNYSQPSPEQPRIHLDENPITHFRDNPEYLKIESNSVEELGIPEKFSSSPGSTHGHYISVWGTIQTEAGGISNFNRVVLFSLSRNKTYRTLSDYIGYFQFDGIEPANDYHLRVDSHGTFVRYIREFVDLTTNQTELNIVLSELPTATLVGEVVDTDGNRIPGFGVKVKSPKKTQWSASAITDDVGEFYVERVPTGRLEFLSTFGQPLLITGYVFEGNLQSPVSLVVDHGIHELRGRVYDQFNNMVIGANVLLEWERNIAGTRSVVYRHAKTNDSGQFLLKGVGNGEHQLTLTTTKGLALRRTVNIGEDNSDLTLIISQPALSN